MDFFFYLYRFEDKPCLRQPGDTSVMIMDCVALSKEILFLGEYDGKISRLVHYDFQVIFL